MHKIPGVQFVQIVERIAAYVKNPPATAALGRQVFGWAGKIGTIRHRKYLKLRRKKNLNGTPRSQSSGRDNQRDPEQKRDLIKGQMI